MIEKKKIERVTMPQHWCVWCLMEGRYVTATHYLYNYADAHTLTLCEACFKVEVEMPFPIDLEMN